MDISKFTNFISVVSGIIGIIGFLFKFKGKQHKWYVFFGVILLVSAVSICLNLMEIRTKTDIVNSGKIDGEESEIDKEILKSKYIENIDILMQQEEYVDAYSILCQALEELGSDADFLHIEEDIIQKYEQYVIDKVEGLVKNCEYENAINEINISKYVLNDSILILNEENKVIEEKIKSECYNYEAENKYGEAINFIQMSYATKLDNIAIVAILDNYKEKYRAQVLYEAQDLFDQDGYLAAIGKLEEGLAILEDDTVLLSKINEYREYKPISLFELEPFQGEGYWFKSIHVPFNDEDNWLVDMYGKEFIEGYVAHHGEEKCEPEAIYLLDKKYTQCSVMLAWPRGASHLAEAGGYIKFYGDGQVIYTSPEIRCGDKPIEFTFDVTGVEQLGFERIATGKGNAWMSVVLIYPYFTLQK